MDFNLTDEMIDTQFGAMKEHAEHMLAEHGGVMGLIDAYCRNGDNFQLPMLYETREEKQVIFAAAKFMFAQQDVIGFFMMTEAWTLHQGLDSKENMEAAIEKGLEHHPDRREVVVIQYVSHEKQIMHTYEMFRDDDGSFSHLGELEKQDEGKIGGTVSEMLPPPKEVVWPEYIH